MAGQLPSFLNGSNVEIVIGGVTVAFARNLNVSRNMSVISVQSIGSYSTQALEPTMFSASGSLTLTRYSSKVLGGGSGGFNRTTNANKRTLPEQLRRAPVADASGLRDGNSIIDAVSFNPRKTLTDRFCEAMLAIREEIREIEEGKADKEDNVLKMAPHTAMELVSNSWSHPYSREKAAYPAPYVAAKKFWPSVARVNDTYGDRNLVCACLPIEAYMENAAQPATA